MTILAVELLHYFNPRPREGGDRNSTKGTTIDIIFQSTPPARGATPVISMKTCNLS